MSAHTPMVVAAARELCHRSAEQCGVDAEDSWEVYGDDFLADAAAMLDACGAPELLEALKALIGHDPDDPLSGWRGHGGDDILFECEYCRAKHEDVTLIPHSDDCPVAKGRAAIAKHGAAL